MATGRRLSQEEVKELMDIVPGTVTLEMLRGYFAVFYGSDKPRFNTFDKFILKKDTWFNDSDVETTVGRYLANITMFPQPFLEKYGYQNETFKKGYLEKIEALMGNMVLNDEMSVEDYYSYINTGEWLGMSQTYYLSPTMDYDINIPIPEVIQLRDELFEKYKDGIRRGDSNVASKIEKEVLALAEKKIKEKGNAAYDFFASGVGKFGNNYKKTSIMAGAIENPYTKKLDILKSNYIDGIDIKEFPKFTNLTIIGGYSRGVETMTSGYETKKINNAMQTLVLDDKDTDCGTKQYNRVTITKDTSVLFIDRYIIDGGRLVLLSSDNINKYIDKEVLLRSPMFCKGDRICNKCAGELFYKLGVKNAGLLTSTLSGTLMNLSMKKFHDATVKFKKVDIEKYIKKH